MNKIPENFDWKFYLDYYQDLRNAGFNTKEQAIRHYLNHGRYEGRVYKDSWIEFQYICSTLSEFLQKEHPKIQKDSDKKSLLVETRTLIHNEFIIKNTIQMLGDGWGHIIYCHKNNHNQIKSICDSISSDIEIRLLDFEIDRNSYNELCLDINFWNQIDCEKVLIYQTDTFICKKFEEKFFEYDYLGANWVDFLSNKLEEYSDLSDVTNGNGGLSLRNVNMIKECLQNEKYKDLSNVTIFDKYLNHIPEDVLYSIYAKREKYITKNNTDDFSIEPSLGHKGHLIESDNPFGFHKLYDFNNYEYIIEKFKKKYQLNQQIKNIKQFDIVNDMYVHKSLQNQNVKISVIITNYNYSKYLEKCINSVLNSTYKNFEILVVDDCSNDNSIEILERYYHSETNFTMILNRINCGVIHSRNIGINYSKGDYVFMLDSDNYIYPNCLEEHLKIIETQNADASYGIIERFVYNVKVDEVSNQAFDLSKLKHGNYIDSMAMYKRSALEEIGGYDYELLNYGCTWEDYELWLKLGTNNYKVVNINKPLSYYNKKNDSLLSFHTYFNYDIKKYLREKYNLD